MPSSRRGEQKGEHRRNQIIPVLSPCSVTAAFNNAPEDCFFLFFKTWRQSATSCVISCPLSPKGTTQRLGFIFPKAPLTCASLNRNLLFSGSHWHSQFSSFWRLNSINMLFTPSSGLLMKNIKQDQAKHPHIHAASKSNIMPIISRIQQRRGY